ncbi:MAG: cysteine desulfurase [Planctomycetales bacterium]|nr:cysteine desulfurase [Planctomycetales bacterium]
MKSIYLDYNATTPVVPSVLEAMRPFLAEHYGNPSSSHALGRACHEAVSDARDHVSVLLGCDPEEIVFTSGGTESNNLALLGTLMGDPGERGHLVISAVEHPSVSVAAQYLQQWGRRVTIVPCDGQGVIDPDAVARAIEPDTRLVSVMHANNETGVIEPIREICRVCHERDVLMHTDAAQSVGKIPVRVDELGVDLLTVAGHKMYAPKGIGALYVRNGTPLTPTMHGAGQESGLRAGTENVSMIVALGKAATLARQSPDEVAPRLEALRDSLWQTLSAELGDEISLNSATAARLPSTLSVNFAGVEGHVLLASIPELAASTGAACHSGSTLISATLAAMGLPAGVAQGAVRLSLGWHTTEADIERAASLLIDAWQRMNR